MLPYALLSLSYESSFMLLLFIILATHVRLEFGHMSDDEFLAMSLPERDIERKLIGGQNLPIQIRLSVINEAI